MKLTNKAIDNIDAAKGHWLKNSPRHGEGINIRNDIFGDAVVYRNDHYLFKLEEMWAVVSELNAMVDIVKETVGIYEEVAR